MPTVEQANNFSDNYYKANGIKRFAKMSKDEIDLKLKSEEEDKDRKLQETLKTLDEGLEQVDANILIDLVKIGVNLTPNKNYVPTSNQRAVEVGLEDYRVRITKKKDQLKLNAGGVTAAMFFQSK
jgi:hypothetical protein